MARRYTLITSQSPPLHAHVVVVACFNIGTGDIGSSQAHDHTPLLIQNPEDAPAPAAIHSFQTHVTDGKIYVTADPANTTKEKTSRPQRLLSSGSEVGGAGVVIVGGGSGAFHATESLREASRVYLLARLSRNLTFTSMDSRRPSQSSLRKRMRPLTGGWQDFISLLKISGLTWSRTKLSKALITDASKLEWRTAADLKIKYGTTLRIGTVGLSSILFLFYASTSLETDCHVRRHLQKNSYS
jgi:hypothetical protein